MRIEHPKQFIDQEPTFKSDLYIKPNTSGFGIIGLIEIIFALFLSGFVFASNGAPASFAQITRIFEQAFNVNLGNAHDRRAQIFRRKSGDITKALNKLTSCIEREYIKYNTKER